MRVKSKNVKIDCLNPFIKDKLKALDSLVMSFTGGELVITSGCEKSAKHMPGSKHYTGEAIDIRTWGIYALRKADLERFMSSLYNIFPDSLYDIVKEKDHIHIEFDVHPEVVKDIKGRFEKAGINPDFIESAPAVDGVVEIPVPDFDFKLPIYYKIMASKELKDVVRLGKFTINAFGKYYTGITIFHPDCDSKGGVKRLVEVLIKLVEVLIERVKR